MNYLKRKLSTNFVALAVCIVTFCSNTMFIHGTTTNQNVFRQGKTLDLLEMLRISKEQDYPSLTDYLTYGPKLKQENPSFFNFLALEEEEEKNQEEIEEVPAPVLEPFIPVEEKSDIMKQKQDYVSIDNVQIFFDMDLNERTGLRKRDFVYLIENVKYDYSGFFAENAEYIYDLCEQYELNEIFFCGLIAAESGWEIRPAHRYTNNYISLMCGSGLIPYSSLEEGLTEAARHLHENYLTIGGKYYNGTKLLDVKKCFCPVSPQWGGLVYGCMELFLE